MLFFSKVFFTEAKKGIRSSKTAPASVTSLGDSCLYNKSKESIFDSGTWNGEPRIIVTTSASPAHVYAKEQSLHYRISTRDEMREEMEEALREKNDDE